METRDLEYLLSVDTHHSIGRAAEALGLSQPAMTKAIQRVEAQVGLLLFERTANGMSPTQAGALFIERARRIQLEYEDALKEMRGIRTGQHGVLRLGYSPSMPDALVLGACRQLVRERPAARLRLRRRLAGELDLAIAPVPRQRVTEFTVVELFNDRLAVVADEAHPLHRRTEVGLPDLVEQEWLLPEPHIALRQQVEAAFHKQGLPEPDVRIEADFGSTPLFHLIRGTHMLTVSGAEASAVRAGLRPLSLGLDELDLRRSVGVVSRLGAYLSPLAQRMIAVLQEHVG